jgi:hypothetical protein
MRMRASSTKATKLLKSLRYLATRRELLARLEKRAMRLRRD